MATSTDFKKFWDRYQKEGVPREISIVQYCQMNGIVYAHFERWYKHYKNLDVIPVEVINVDHTASTSSFDVGSSVSKPLSSVNALDVLSFEIVFCKGLTIHHHNMDYPPLKSLVAKLEVLC